MKNRYITTLILAAAAGTGIEAQQIASVPKLVVNIAVEQLDAGIVDERDSYTNNKLRAIIQNSIVYTSAEYPFSPVDRASAIAALSTGTTPYYNNIVGCQWLDRSTLRPVSCVDDSDYAGIFTQAKSSPSHLQTSTIGDELKVRTAGKAVVYSIAENRDAAILSAGHAANGAMWMDDGENKGWCTSTYYYKEPPKWMEAYHKLDIPSDKTTNDRIIDAALQCVRSNAMGFDYTTDMLFVTLSANKTTISATGNKAKRGKRGSRQQSTAMATSDISRDISRLVESIEQASGPDNVLFVITGTGTSNETPASISEYRIPSGTFYINRTANLLNMYLGAIYGEGKYVISFYNNHIYLDNKLIDNRRISRKDMLERAQTFLVQCAGVKKVYTSDELLTTHNSGTEKIRNGYSLTGCGDIIIETAPGWQLLNEENNQNYSSRMNFTPIPIIIYGCSVKPQRIYTTVTLDRIAPTIAKTIRIRAPNACQSHPLF